MSSQSQDMYDKQVIVSVIKYNKTLSRMSVLGLKIKLSFISNANRVEDELKMQTFIFINPQKTNRSYSPMEYYIESLIPSEIRISAYLHNHNIEFRLNGR